MRWVQPLYEVERLADACPSMMPRRDEHKRQGVSSLHSS